MPVTKLLRRFSDLIGFRIGDTDENEQRPAPRTPLRSKLAGARGKTVVGGVVELLGLGEIRARLGEDWSVVAPSVDDIVAVMFAELLGPEDAFERVGDDYVIFFDNPSKSDGKRVAEEIARAIHDELIEQAAILGVDVASGVDELAVDRLLRSENPSQAMRSALVARQEDATGPRRISHSPQILFQPIWPTSRWGRAQNRCMIDSVSGVAIARQFKQLEDAAALERAVAELDLSLLSETISTLQRDGPKSRGSTVLVPIQFHSLLGPEALDLVTVGAGAPPGNGSVVFDIIGIPATASSNELLKAARTAREACDSVVMQIHPGDGRCRRSLVELLAGASLNLGDLGDELDEHELTTFTALCADLGLLSYAFGANTMGRALVATRSGFDYVAGAAVHPLSASPRSDARFVPLFGSTTDVEEDRPRPDRRLSTRFVPVDPNSMIELPGGKRSRCKVKDVSGAGAAISTSLRPEPGTEVMLGSLPARVVRHTDGGVVVKFHRLHPPSMVETALKLQAGMK